MKEKIKIVSKLLKENQITVEEATELLAQEYITQTIYYPNNSQQIINPWITNPMYPTVYGTNSVIV